MKRPATQDIECALRDGDAIDRAIVASRRRVIVRHRQMNVPLAIWQNGEVVEIPPDSAEVPAEGNHVDSSGSEH